MRVTTTVITTLDESSNHQQQPSCQQLVNDLYIADFIRQLKQLDRQCKSVKHMMQSAYPQHPQSVLKEQVTEYKLERINRRERQEDMRRLLVDSVKLTKKLREQINVL